MERGGVFPNWNIANKGIKEEWEFGGLGRDEGH